MEEQINDYRKTILIVDDEKMIINLLTHNLTREGYNVLEAKDGTLLARCIQHEFDHLDGILFVDHCLNRFEAEEVLKKYNLPPLQVEKLLDEPELTAQVEEIKQKQLEIEKEKAEKKDA